MENLVVLKRDDLEELLRQAAVEARAETTSEPARKSKMNIDETVIYLNNSGYSISKSTIYKHTMNGTIPFSRFGERKMVFDADEIDQWVNERSSVNDAAGGFNQITNTVADAARRKGRRV